MPLAASSKIAILERIRKHDSKVRSQFSDSLLLFLSPPTVVGDLLTGKFSICKSMS